MFVRLAIACVAYVAARKFLKTNKATTEPAAVVDSPRESETTVTDFLAPEITVGGVTESETKTLSTTAASEAILDTTNEDEVTSKPAQVAGIQVDAFVSNETAPTDSLDVTPRKSSLSKLMKKVSNVVSSPKGEM